jgi:hypothetical protein
MILHCVTGFCCPAFWDRVFKGQMSNEDRDILPWRWGLCMVLKLGNKTQWWNAVSQKNECLSFTILICPTFHSCLKFYSCILPWSVPLNRSPLGRRHHHIIIIGSTALVGPWPTQANVTSDLYLGHLPANFYNPVSLHLPLPRQSILISVSHVLFDLQGLSITYL